MRRITCPRTRRCYSRRSSGPSAAHTSGWARTSEEGKDKGATKWTAPAACSRRGDEQAPCSPGLILLYFALLVYILKLVKGM